MATLLMVNISFSHTNQSLGSRQLENSLRIYERESFKISMSKVKSRDVRIRGFYHTSTWKDYWKDVISEQLIIMDGMRNMSSDIFRKERRGQVTQQRKSSSVFELVDFIHITVGGSRNDYLHVEQLVRSLLSHRSESIKLFHNETVPREDFDNLTSDEKMRTELSKNPELSSGEMASLLSMQDYCIDQQTRGQTAFVFYLHNKGSCCTHSARQTDFENVTLITCLPTRFGSMTHSWI